jgi:hypothetical protein
LIVPVYQRPFAWTEDRVKDFWDDVTNAIDRKDPEYFIGTVVISDELLRGRKQIIDGQQRIATVTILLSAIRDLLRASSQPKAAETIQAEFIASYDIAQKALEPKLSMSSDDAIFFRRFIVEGETNAKPVDNRESNRLIIAARRFFDGQLAALKHEKKNWYADVVGVASYVENNLRSVLVTVSSEADAFTIFETLNDRGADLTVSDLLKNYLFGRAGDAIDAVRDNWMQAVGTLEASGKVALVDFLRHLWSAKHGATREKDLYSSIKKVITTKQEALSFSEYLQQAAQIYAALSSSDHEYWRAKSTATRKDVQSLLRLDLDQLKPLLISIMLKFPDKAIPAAMRALINWSIRGLIVGGVGGGRTEKAYTEAAMKVQSGEITSVAALKKVLGDVVRSDAEFGQAFSRAQITKSSLARYLLLALEAKKRSDSDPELVANEEVEKVNLEHILPKNAAIADWDEFSAGQKRAYTHRIGNLVLLRSDHNSTIGNKPWSVKKPILAASKLQLTSHVAKHGEWNTQAIDERQKELAALAVRTWPS